MLLNEIVAIGAGTRLQLTRLLKNKTKKVQPVEPVDKTRQEPDVKKKPVPKGRIDTYA